MMQEPESIADFSPEDIDVQAIDGFHLGGNRFSASFELSDPDGEFSRSYLLEIELGKTVQFDIRLQIEDAIRSHVSFAPHDHIALELGGIIHELPPGGSARTELPEGVLTRLWAPSRDRVFAFGEHGVSYVREEGNWTQLETFNEAVLNDMDGRTGGPVYCVGDRGILLQLQERRWDPIDLGVQHHFQAVLVGPEGELYLGGRDGAAFEMRNSELVALDGETVDYFDICEFQGNRYWSDMDYGVSLQNERTLTQFAETEQAFSMSATDDYLVVAGWHEFFVFDGREWSGFELGYTGDIFLRRIDMADYGL